MKPSYHPVIFAGAGPGDPDLITVKAMKALAAADLVIFAGSLVPETVLCWVKPETRTISSAGLHLDQIIDTIRTGYQAGQRVVRLHTGDPSLYGAIFEQIRELEKSDIPVSVIPGVTAAFAASAAMHMEYTLPELTQTLILTRISGRTPVPDTENLESLAAHQASMAIYLSMGHARQVQNILQTHYGEDACCAIAYKVSHPEEKIIPCRIKDLDQTCRENAITRHALIIVGKAVAACMKNQDLVPSKLYDAGFSHGYRNGGE
ncbi:MAG TPA: precorrin-4 C(11)-methyltransferase [Desulfotignum sp.]|nr:precorrin-4 C(11)-methyltransferase [Desulfotignum sp.]